MRISLDGFPPCPVFHFIVAFVTCSRNLLGLSPCVFGCVLLDFTTIFVTIPSSLHLRHYNSSSLQFFVTTIFVTVYGARTLRMHGFYKAIEQLQFALSPPSSSPPEIAGLTSPSTLDHNNDLGPHKTSTSTIDTAHVCI
jgi:hypothetical protein